jgi:hypothetical protein
MTVKYKPEDYEGDMARLCEKIRQVDDNNYEFSTEKMVRPRTPNLDGQGRSAYSKEGYDDIKIPILEEMGFIEMTSADKFRLTNYGKEYCKKSTIV